MEWHELRSLEMNVTWIVRLDALQPNEVAIEWLQVSRPIEHQAHTLQSITAVPLSIFEDRHDLEPIAFPTF